MQAMLQMIYVGLKRFGTLEEFFPRKGGFK
jgi:hypothetical protein